MLAYLLTQYEKCPVTCREGKIYNGDRVVTQCRLSQDYYWVIGDNRAGMADYFMGVGQKAKFIGHGIGLEINEAPVIAPRMKQELEPGMVFALEPKIVLPGVGPVGIENSWAVGAEGLEKLTICEESIIEL